MSDTKRVNVSIPNQLLELIKALAYRDDIPVTTKTLELIKQGLEIEEDTTLIEIMETRESEDTESAQWIEHEDFWKSALDK
mgnify:CR=1 FL=1